jgi:hypothetical protein
MKLGSTRVVRVDAHNVAVQQFVEVEVSVKGGDGKRSKTGEMRQEWQERGYFGHRLDHAAESALFLSMPIDESITAKMVKDAIAEITENTKGVL